MGGEFQAGLPLWARCTTQIHGRSAGLLARMFSNTSTVLRTEYEYEHERCCSYSYSVPAGRDGTRTRHFDSKMCGTVSRGEGQSHCRGVFLSHCERFQQPAVAPRHRASAEPAGPFVDRDKDAGLAIRLAESISGIFLDQVRTTLRPVVVWECCAPAMKKKRRFLRRCRSIVRVNPLGGGNSLHASAGKTPGGSSSASGRASLLRIMPPWEFCRKNAAQLFNWCFLWAN
jgi:hypothetical protein